MAKSSTFVRALWSALIAVLVTAAFEVTKHGLYPRLSMRQSHLVTILFGALFGFILSLFIARSRRTDLKRLYDEQANFEILIEHLPGLSCIIDADKKLVRWNSRFQNALGYSAEELAGMPAAQTITEDYRELVPEQMGVAWKTGYADMEAAWLTKEGKRIPCYFTGVRITVEGRPCILSVGIDIGKRKQAEEALRKSEESYRRLLGNLPDVTWTTEQTGRTTYMSPNVKEIFGYAAEECCKGGGELWFSRIHHADLERVQQAFRALFEGNHVFSVEYRIQCRDGRWIWVHDRAIRTHVENGVVFADGVFSDITERKRAEQAASQLASIVDSSSDAIIGKSPEGKIVSWNPAAIRIFGYSEEEALGKHISMLTPSERMHEMPDFMGRIARGEQVERFDSVCLRKDGSRFDASLAVSPIMDKTGTVLGISTIANDISLRKRAERELLRAKEAAEEAARAKTEFLAHISQELRTPINGILGMTELALDTQLDAEQREYLLTAQSFGNALLRLISDLLDFSKTESGGLQLELAPFNLPETVRQTLRPLLFQAQQVGLEPLCQIDSNLPDTVIGDPGRLRQVLVNLVGNAIKFTQQGTIAIRARNGSCTGSTVEVLFTVRDTGIGIPIEKQTAILEPFTQNDGTATRKHGSSGLAISSRLVELMGGKLLVDSSPGHGSTFSFALKFETADRTALAVQN
jgi:two-component system sensor histidine kinase/response regulator